jgi:2-polyprenyl-3-methyl-5-hydroxy-6-metoxy-1,4-benzoquinol methylase
MKQKTGSDWAWEKYGEKDPYYGVWTDEQFKAKNLSDEAIKEFFKSGASHVEAVITTIHRLQKDFSPKTVLDYGCGTGRLVVPFAGIAKNVTGIDVSKHMLDEANHNLERFKVQNVELLHSNSPDIIGTRRFDLVHSFIVLQHIPVSHGYEIFEGLAKAVAPGGFGALHITYASKQSWIKRQKTKLRSEHKWFAQLSNILRFRNPNQAEIQMNNYDLGRVYQILASTGIDNVMTLPTNHGGFLGLFFFFENSKDKKNLF